MPGLIEAYVKSMWREARVHAMYPPDNAVKVGDVFEVSHGAYSRLFNLSDQMGDLEIVEAAVADWASKASDGTAVEAAVNGKLPDGTMVSALAKVGAGVAVQLKGSSSYVAALTGVTKSAFGALKKVQDHIRGQFWSGDWDASWIVASEVYRARNAIFIGGSSTATTVALEASVDVKLSHLRLVDLAGKFKVVDESSAAMVVAGEDLTPIFRGYKFNLLQLIGEGAAAEELDVAEWNPDDSWDA
jgi:hypothetical protein